MPMITVEFTEEELAFAKAHAASLGKSMRSHAHDIILADAQRTAFLQGVDETVAWAMDVFKDMPEGMR
ncbi:MULTISPECIES: hypothetical protein [Streptomyces]|uniref:Antitoxin n=1 Tax=Streptomyces umbrinus TaxID=67370 RepID=A0ABU0T1H1_9ACTN|nr:MULTISPECIES: hypothetical protein [Streptomyces]MCX4557646.1 hypothetical protein [Streptomyces phaeochromogenes]MCZ4514171.1 hypothetical protein [Streptomyces sp. ActVer]MDQ1029658.1 hypothetical protein [Streptomyces umbrinus]